MKNSYYNIFYPQGNQIIGYNSISDNFIVFEKLLFDLYQASLQEESIESLKDVHVDLYETLKNKGFIIEEQINELEVIKEISRNTDFNEKNYELIINSTMNCNFKCWYCYESHIKDSKVSDQTLSKIIGFIDNILKKKKGELKNFNLEWFGGEPLLYFNKTILPLLKNVYPKMVANGIDFKSNFTTNAYLINQELLDECKKYGVKHFQITLDGNKELHNKVRFVSKTKGSYDKIISNIKLCLKNKFRVTARINISENTLPGLLDVINDFKEISQEDNSYLVFSFHEVWQEKKDLKSEISEIVKEYRRYGFNTTFIGESNASIRRSCYADKLNHATINYNGDVFKCTAREFDKKSREGVLEENGEIDWNNKITKRLYDTRFKNKPCLECKILPICNGGCSQIRLENEGKDYCVHNFDTEKKLNIVKEKFNTRIDNKGLI